MSATHDGHRLMPDAAPAWLRPLVDNTAFAPISIVPESGTTDPAAIPTSTAKPISWPTPPGPTCKSSRKNFYSFSLMSKFAFARG